MHALGSSPFYGLYPVVAGVPLAAWGPSTGLVFLKALQAVLVSLTAAIVYLWVRRLVSGWWAFAGAAMTAALPALGYSGLIMTESVFLPVITLALWLIARALTTPSLRNQLLAGGAVTLAIAMRFQSISLLLSILLSLALYAWFERELRNPRQFIPLGVSCGIGLIVIELARLAIQRDGSMAYGSTAHGRLHLESVVSWSLKVLGDLYLLVIGLPLVALCALAITRLVDPGHDSDLSALLAVTIAYVCVTTVEVGAFLSIYSQRIQERYLIGMAPPLFVVASVWFARTMPRPQPATAVVALLVCLPAATLPIRHLAVRAAVPDSFMVVGLLDFSRRTSVAVMAHAWLAAVVVVILLALLVPGRYAPLFVVLVITSLCVASLLAQRSVASAAAYDRADFFGRSSPQWIDVHGRSILYVDDNDVLWNDVLHQIYWNPEITGLALLRHRSQLPEGFVVGIRGDGRIFRKDGRPLTDTTVVAPRRLTFVGDQLQQLTQGQDEPGLIVWRLRGAPRLSMRTNGVLTGDEISVTAKITVYACGHGALELRLASQDGPAKINLSLDNSKSVQTLVKDKTPQRIFIPVQGKRDRRTACVFYLSPQGTFLLTKIAFDAGPFAIPPDIPLHRLGHHRTIIASTTPVTPSLTPAASTYQIHVGYCLGGAFVQLAYNQVRSDPKYKGATPANFIAGEGITCSQPPAGYLHDGFATADLGVPPGIYPYYRHKRSGG
jgi:hypothetical protein